MVSFIVPLSTSPCSHIFVRGQWVTLFLRPENRGAALRLKETKNYTQIFVQEDPQYWESRCINIETLKYHDDPLFRDLFYADRIILGLKHPLSTDILHKILNEIDLGAETGLVLEQYKRKEKEINDDFRSHLHECYKTISQYIFAISTHKISKQNKPYQHSLFNISGALLGDVVNPDEVILAIEKCQNIKTLLPEFDLALKNHLLTYSYYLQPISEFLDQLKKDIVANMERNRLQNPMELTFKWQTQRAAMPEPQVEYTGWYIDEPVEQSASCCGGLFKLFSRKK